MALPAGGVGDDGRDDVEVGAAERVDDGGHAPVQQVASHVEYLGKRERGNNYRARLKDGPQVA